MAFTLTRSGGGELSVSLTVYGEHGHHHARLSVMGAEIPGVAVMVTDDQTGEEVQMVYGGGPELLIGIGGNQEKDEAVIALETGLQEVLQAFLNARGI